jgi:hypothetical protein
MRPSLQRFWDLLGDRSRSPLVPRERTSGDPPSANGASSFHLRWELPPAVPRAGLREVSVTLEVVSPPEVPRLYFWALQADFADRAGRRAGGAHLGLQWHPQHPGSTAVNWGGYGPDGRELGGSDSGLPSALRNVNTRDMRWSPRHPYRLTIARHGDERPVWRGSVTRPDGEVVVVRDLHPPGDRIDGVVMWSEVFARCDDPSVGVRWSDPVAVTLDGMAVAPARLSVNYQSHVDGGCANTDSRVDGIGVVQWTNAARSTPQGAVLGVPHPPADA